MGFVIKMDQQGGKFHLHKVELFLHFQLKVTEETPRELLRHAFCACVYFYFYHSSNSPPCDCPRVYHGASGLSRCLGSIYVHSYYFSFTGIFTLVVHCRTVSYIVRHAFVSITLLIRTSCIYTVAFPTIVRNQSITPLRYSRCPYPISYFLIGYEPGALAFL